MPANTPTTASATMTLAGRFQNRTTRNTTVSAFDSERVTVTVPGGYDAQHLAWVEFSLPSGETVRPLIEVRPIAGVGVVSGRIRYLCAEDREAIERFEP